MNTQNSYGLRQNFMPSWHKTPPNTREPHEHIHNSKTFKWCATCKLWFFGDYAHFTQDYIEGFRNKPTSSSANIGMYTIDSQES
jgi:hypothetical protein